MNAARFLGERHALDPMYAGFIPQGIIRIGTCYLQREVVNDVRLPSAMLGILLIHFFQIASEYGRLVAAGARTQFHHDRNRRRARTFFVFLQPVQVIRVVH